MAPLTLTSNRITFSAEVPPQVGRALRRLRGAGRRVGSGDVKGALHLAQRTPDVRPVRRDPSASIPFFRVGQGRSHGEGAAPGCLLPEGWGAKELADAVSSLWWYHSIDLPHGITTPGIYDHRALVAQYGLPHSLEGQRVLDVATFDGFWAFAFERLGGEVTATDISSIGALDLPGAVRDALVAEDLDWGTGNGFRLAHQALGSAVDRVELSVYDLDPADLGMFDLVHMSDLLLHLRDPIGALAAVARVTRGSAVITDCYDPDVPAGLSRYGGGWAGATWWLPSLETLVQMVADAGFADVHVRRTFNLPTTESGKGFWRASLLATK